MSTRLHHISYVAHDETETDHLGACLAQLLPDGAVIALIGTLGAGKTRLVQAVATASGVPSGTVSSPTFVLIHEYEEGDRPIYHFDAYRLETETEFQNLGPEEYFEGFGLSFVEWADKIPKVMPQERIEISIEILDVTQRQFNIFCHGKSYNRFFEQISKKLA